MLNRSYPSGGRAPRRKRRSLFPTAALVAISMSPLAYFADFSSPSDPPPVEQVGSIARQAPAPQAAVTAHDAALVDPMPAMRTGAHPFARNAPLQTAFKAPPVQHHASIAPVPPPLPETPAPVQEMGEAARSVPTIVPLPVPRPAALVRTKPAPTQMASARTSAPMTQRTAIAATVPADNRSFFEKLFGIKPASPPDAALSYAALDKGTGSISPTSRFVPAPDTSGARTAVYDISAQVVIMPNGERLEAHSGLGDMMDNPRHVNVRMKGSTPPGTYVLTERERLFHGVRAIRLNPVGGSAAIYGRDGILAHTYLLGPRGDSNGCVSFKNYDRFLQAFLRGEVKRLVVTAGRGQDLVPPMASRSRTARRSARAI